MTAPEEAMTASTARGRDGGSRFAILSPRSRIDFVAYGIVLPAVVFRAAFTLFPAIRTIWLSFTNQSLTNPGHFVGFSNYVRMLGDQTLIGALGFTVAYTAASVVAETALGLCAAMLILSATRGRTLTNFILLLPWAVAPLLAATIWKILYYEQGGVLNDIFERLGLISEPIRWLSDARIARASVVIVTVWRNVSWVALIFMAALGGLPRDIYEAAAIDGANAWQRFRWITLPLLKPTFLLILVFRGMGEAQTFEQINGLTRGGPGAATTTLALYAYQRFFEELRYGYGSAVNVLLLLLTMLIGGVLGLMLYRAGR